MKPKMTRSTIEQLLTRFMNGETTLDEERLLADYFRQADNVDEAWKDYREMFLYFDRGMDVVKEKNTGWGHWLVAAMLAALLVGGSLILWNRQGSEEQVVVKTEPKETEQRDFKTKPTTFALTPPPEPAPKQKAVKPKRAPKKEEPTRKAISKEDYEPTEQEIEDDINEEIIWRKSAIIKAALMENGYMPVTQEDGSVAYEKASETVSI